MCICLNFDRFLIDNYGSLNSDRTRSWSNLLAPYKISYILPLHSVCLPVSWWPLFVEGNSSARSCSREQLQAISRAQPAYRVVFLWDFVMITQIWLKMKNAVKIKRNNWFFRLITKQNFTLIPGLHCKTKVLLLGNMKLLSLPIFISNTSF